MARSPSPIHETLWCVNFHNHVMAPLQAARLEGEPCWQCGEPMMRWEALRALVRSDDRIFRER